MLSSLEHADSALRGVTSLAAGLAVVVGGFTSCEAQRSTNEDGPASAAEEPLPVEEAARTTGTPVIVTGALSRLDGELVLCSSYEESLPVSCVGASLLVAGLSQEEADRLLYTSEAEFLLRGTVDQSTLTVTEVLQR